MKDNMEKKLQELAMNPEFVKKVQALDSIQEALALVKDYGIEMSETELVEILSASEETEGELSEEMLDSVAGGGKLWNWIKKKFSEWFDRQSRKNADDIGDILSRI